MPEGLAASLGEAEPTQGEEREGQQLLHLCPHLEDYNVLKLKDRYLHLHYYLILAEDNIFGKVSV